MSTIPDFNSKLTKAEKRALRRIGRAEKEKAKSLRLSADVAAEIKAPRMADIAPLQRAPRPALLPDEQKTVRTGRDPYSEVLDCQMTWCQSNADTSGSWSWIEPRQWTAEEWEQEIAPALNEMAKQTWQIILNEHKVKAKGEKMVPKHHHQEISTLTKEAQDRWLEHNLDEYDTAFRFRFGGTKRAWGVRLLGHFYLIWWERHHKIYPV